MLRAGERIGPLRIERPIGAGGMGEVYLARDERLERRVAIKLLPSSRSLDPAARKRLLREARAASALQHPSIVTVHDVGDHEGLAYIVMEYVNGETLSALVQRRGRLPAAEAVELLAQACDAVAAAHDAGVLHRDIKSANLMIDAVGRVKVLDFGLCKRTDVSESPDDAPVEVFHPTQATLSSRGEVDDLSLPAPLMPPTADPVTTSDPGARGEITADALTVAGARMGTPGWAAPELIDGKPADVRSDVFALGCVLYHLLTDALPFPGTTWSEQRVEIDRGPEPPGRLVPDIPAALEAVVLAALATDPAGRPQSVRALADAAAAALAGGRSRRRRALLATAGVVGVAAVVTVTLVARGAMSDPDQSAQEVAPACSDDGSTILPEIWAPGDRTALARAFAATGLPYAADTATAVIGMLDRWAEAWQVEYGDACTEPARVRCLRQAGQVTADLAALLMMADRDIVGRAVTAVQELAPPEQCGVRSAVRLQLPPPPPAVAARIDELDVQIRDLENRVQLGQAATTVDRIAAVVAAARSTNYGPSLASAYHMRGIIEHALGRPEAFDTLEEAALAAEGSRDDFTNALVRILQIEVLTFAERLDDARRAGRRAEASIQRFGGDPGLEARLARALGIMEMHAENYEQALGYLQRALVLDERRKQSTAIALDQGNLAALYANMSRYPESIALNRQVLDRYQRELGPHHPIVAQTLATLSVALYRTGELDEAESVQQRALVLFLDNTGPDGDEVHQARQRLAVIHSAQGRAAEARAELEALITALAASRSADHPELLEARGNLVVVLGALGDYRRAEAELRAIIAARPPGARNSYVANDLANLSALLHLQGRDREARDAARRALAAVAEAGASDTDEAGFALVNLADAERDLGALADADAHYQRAQAIFEATFGADHVTVAYTLTGRGRLLLARRQAAAALPLLERAVALRTDGDPFELGESQLALADALAATGAPARARQQAEAARASYDAAGARAGRERAAVDAWLARRAKAPR